MRICAAIPLRTALVALAAVCLLAPMARASGLTPVRLRCDGRDLGLRSPALWDGRDVYVPLEALQPLGATYTVTRRDETAIVSVATGARTEVALARPRGQLMLPLSALLPLLKREAGVRAGTCELRAPGSGGATPPRPLAPPVASPPPARPSAQKPGPAVPAAREAPAQPAPPRQHADVVDGSPPPAPTRPPAHEARIDVDLPPAPGPAGPQAPGVQRPDGLDPARAPSPGPSPAPPSRATTAPPAAPRAPRPVLIQQVQFEPTDSAHARLRIRTTAKVKGWPKLLHDPTRLAVDIPNSALGTDQREWPVEHPLLKGVHATDGDRPGVTRLVLDLARLVSYRVVNSGRDEIAVNLGLPRGTGRRMQDLIVAVDPGHGGSATGCHAVEDGRAIYEKNLTLQIALRLRDLLAEAGVNVVMTRTGDYDPGLYARPAVAADNNADLFVSLHIDDCPGQNNASGSTAYYHMSDTSSRALAESIIGQIARVSGLPSRGARSDGSLYQSGLAVLRTSTMPAVLVEVGYINHVRDRRKLLEPEFQQSVAQAICDGIRGYVEGLLPDGEAPPLPEE